MVPHSVFAVVSGVTAGENAVGWSCPVALVGKSPADSARDKRDSGLIPGSGRSPGEGHGKPTPVFLPGESHGQRSLAGYGP